MMEPVDGGNGVNETIAEETLPVARSEPVTVLGKLNQQHTLLADEPSKVDDGTVSEIVADARMLADTLESPRERAVANRIARFWSGVSAERAQARETHADAFVDGAILSTITPTRAGPLVQSRDQTATYQSPPVPPSRKAGDTSGVAIQVIAVARRWREAGKPFGYLLWGKALKEARQFVGMDPDVQALVETSDRTQKRILINLCLLIALISIVYYLDLRSKSEAASALAAATQQRLTLEAQEATATRKRIEVELAATDLALQQQRQLNVTLSERLAAATGRSVNQRDLLASPGNDLSPVASNVGYDHDFLGASECGATNNAADKPEASDIVAVPLPKIGTSLANYVGNVEIYDRMLNFSVLYSSMRGLPVLSASNICRTLLQGIVVEQQQMRSAVSQAGLVSPQEIAWGQSGGQAVADAAKPANLTKFTPASAANWQALRRYAIAGFNPAAAKVSAFSGPVFAPVRAGQQGATEPAAYFMVLVSIRPGHRQELVVEAYMLPQKLPAPEGIANGDPSAQQLLLRATTTTIDQIEAVTGLTFDVKIRAASSDTPPAPGLPAAAADSPGTHTAATVPGIDSPDQDIRKRTTQGLIDALRDGGLKEPSDQRVTIEALLTLMALPSFSQLTPNARVNLALVLSAIPETIWTREDMRLLKARARRAIADIENAVFFTNQLPSMPQAFAHFDNAKKKLSFGLGEKRTIDLQFAVLPRGTIESLRARLQPLGWYLPNPSDRSERGNGLNEVRFSPDDAAAGRQLADDISVLGYSISAVPTPDMQTGTLSVSISKGRESRSQSSSSAK